MNAYVIARSEAVSPPLVGDEAIFRFLVRQEIPSLRSE